jgi:3-deoxy-7-phosphoheptulonate synthase
MREMLRLGLPVATELLQPMAAGYFDDLLSWVAIGARTTESQIHREMASGLGMPVGFKNGTDGGVAIACDAMRSASHPHRHFGVDSQGHGDHPDPGQPGHPPGAARRSSRAELRCAERGAGETRPGQVQGGGAHHGRLQPRQQRQGPIAPTGGVQRCAGAAPAGDASLIGMMLESHLFDGCQPLSASMKYGVSVTDGCLGWNGTSERCAVPPSVCALRPEADRSGAPMD